MAGTMFLRAPRGRSERLTQAPEEWRRRNDCYVAWRPRSTAWPQRAWHMMSSAGFTRRNGEDSHGAAMPLDAVDIRTCESIPDLAVRVCGQKVHAASPLKLRRSEGGSRGVAEVISNRQDAKARRCLRRRLGCFCCAPLARHFFLASLRLAVEYFLLRALCGSACKFICRHHTALSPRQRCLH